MALIKVNPNRMEVLRLRKRLMLCRRGHRLLKQKQDELMRILTRLIDEARKLREEVEKRLANAFQLFLLAEGTLGQDMMENAISFLQVEASLEKQEKRLLNLQVPELSLKIEGDIYNYGFLRTNSDLDKALSLFSEIMPELIKLCEIEKKLFIVALEVEKTRRRVNALEYILIPDLEETVKRIVMKLEEIERGARVRLMKVKELVG